MPKFLKTPYREIAVIVIVTLALGLSFIWSQGVWLLWVGAIAGSLPVFADSARDIWKRKITIDTFNAFVLVISFAADELRSAAFIVLMLAFASILEWRTESRSRRAVEELLKLKPAKAVRERDGKTQEIGVEDIRKGDVLIIAPGDRIPADGRVIRGKSLVNEAPVTGESVPVNKAPGNMLLSGTLNQTGVLRLRVTQAGEDSTLQQMARLIEHASSHKSRAEKMADRFAGAFLPVVILAGALTFFITRDILMTSAVFLVACADDMAVAIPLAMTASIGRAAARGIVVKGGEWLDAMGKVDTVVLDKTGTLTLGEFAFREARMAPGMDEGRFWTLVGAAERFSGHPMGQALFKEAESRIKNIPEAESAETFEGIGIEAAVGSDRVAIGNEHIGEAVKAPDMKLHEILEELEKKYGGTTVAVLINHKFAGVLAAADVARPEAKQSIERMREIGVRQILMFTGDREEVAKRVAEGMHLDGYRASMTPQDKFRELEELSKKGVVAMVGDGINDAPALARANVGIAMGKGGTSVAVEAADVVILTDNLDRIPELIALGRRTASVIRWDMGIWLVSNLVGFSLVFKSILGPALAAFYNFATDFMPLINSTRLFRYRSRFHE